MAIVQHADDRDAWNHFVADQCGPHASFLQSWEWGQVQEAAGRTVHRIQIERGDTLAAQALCVELPLPMGKTYLFSPRGPVIAEQFKKDESVMNDLIAEVRDVAPAVFWRCEPEHAMSGGRQVKDVEPRVTRVIDLSKTESDLMAAMKQKTRYNIRLAAKKGVSVELVHKKSSTNLNDVVGKFWTLLKATSERHGIRHHDKAYYAAMITTLVPAGFMEVAIARHGGTVLGVNLMVRFGDTTTYLHGASSEDKKEFMAPHLLQWEAIRHAKQQGSAWYDFFGVSPAGATNHPLAGVTRFKEGFAGEILEYPGTFEFPLSAAWYRIYRMAKGIRSRA